MICLRPECCVTCPEGRCQTSAQPPVAGLLDAEWRLAMRSVHLLLVLGVAVVGVAWLVFSCGPSRHRQISVADSQASDPARALVIGDPVVFQNLTIFPVSSRTPRISDRFITLDEGLRAGTVEIYERGAVAAPDQRQDDDPFAVPPASPANTLPGSFAAPATDEQGPRHQGPSAANDPFTMPGQQSSAVANSTVADSGSGQREQVQRRPGNSVNELMVINRSEKPLYLMPGEIIVGGDQDRTIGEELVVAPDGKPVSLDVFCVEHGRWGRRDAQEYAAILSTAETAGSSTTTDAEGEQGPIQGLAYEANLGKFIGSVGSLSKPARLAVQRGDGQVKVWDEVESANARSNVEAATGTFTANYSDVELLERLRPYMDHLRDPITETDNVVGVIVAVNGEMESMDVFQSTPLFRKLWPK